MDDRIITISSKEDEKFLRKKTVSFDFKAHTRKDVSELVRRMRDAMKRANGIGLSANQLGLPHRVFVAFVPGEQGKMKFYALFNPVLEKESPEKILFEEGCLSVPRTYGTVERAERITVTAEDRNGRKVKIKAWGLLARVFQHELDHLNGVLFSDTAKQLQTITPPEASDSPPAA